MVPSQTELLYELGLHEQVIGITKFCIHPKSWHYTKTRFGGTKNVNTFFIEAHKPDLVIANKEENVKSDIDAIQKFTDVYVSDVNTINDSIEMISQIGFLTGTEQRAEEIIHEIQSEFATLPYFEPLRALYLIWRAPYMTVGTDTFIHHIMQFAGFDNVIQKERYPEVNFEEIQSLNPEVVLLSSEPYPFKEKHIEELKTLLPTAKIILVDGEMFSWYGSRIRQTPAYIKLLREEISQ